MNKQAEPNDPIQMPPPDGDCRQALPSPLQEISDCLFNLAKGLCRGRDRSFSAEDVRQNAMLAVLKLPQPGVRVPRDIPLLREITRHAFLDLLRRNRAYADEEISDNISREVSAKGVNHEEQLHIDEAYIREIMTNVLSSDREREVFAGLVEDGCTLEEIARRTGLTVMAVRVTKNKIHDKVSRYLLKGR
jgi:RNA polymerase sigma factor (sigma-70 family)